MAACPFTIMPYRGDAPVNAIDGISIQLAAFDISKHLSLSSSLPLGTQAGSPRSDGNASTVPDILPTAIGM